MSATSTPNRSRASSASSSPASRVAKSPMELTPRSKVKAMLAAAGMSDDSEDDVVPAKTAKKPTTDAPAKTASLDSASSDDDDEDDVVTMRKPAGKMAARMLARRQEESRDDDGEEEENSYARVRRMLMSGKDKRKETQSSPAAENANDAASSEEDEPVSKTTRRRSPKSATPASRASSPGLFVSPARPAAFEPESDEEDINSTSNSNAKSKLEELVARKRAERKEREAANKTAREESRRKAKANRRAERDLAGSESDSDDDEEIGKKLTQQSRPTRKASKKAIEEMNRETQRMSRSMQLTHRAKTKKKYTTKDLFARFNYGQPRPIAEETQQSNETPNTSSDADQREKETPPTSPPSFQDVQPKDPKPTAEIDQNGFRLDTVVDIGQDAGDDDLPDLGKLLTQSKKIDKGKGRAVSEQPSDAVSAPKPAVQKSLPEAVVPQTEQRLKAFRVIPQKPTQPAADDDDDDDLEIIPTRFAVFDTLPIRKSKEPSALLALRHLAHLNHDDNIDSKGRRSMTAGELQASLKAKAREQAMREKAEKIELLKAKGIFVQTEEERERDQLELENLLEKARREDEELAKKEKAEKKAEGGGDDFLDSSDDESYVEDGEGADEEEQDIEMSGSEEEGEEDEEDEEAADAGDGLIDNEAGEEDDEEMADDEANVSEAPVEAEVDHMEEGSDGEETARRTLAPRGRRRVVDEDDDDTTEPQPSAPQSQPPTTQDQAMAAFGFAPAAPPMGLSQMFAGTMADPESQVPPTAVGDSQQDSLDFLRSMPSSSIPGFDMGMTQASQQSVVRDSMPPPSQTAEEHGQISLGLSQFPTGTAEDGRVPSTQMSEMPDPTQDGGFDVSRSPLKFAQRTPVPSSAGANGSGVTVDTVILPQPESPQVQKKKGRLQRGKKADMELSDVDQDEDMSDADSESAAPEPEGEDADEDFHIDRSAFDVLRKGAKKQKKRQEAFDKKNSAAKDMVYEQAEESEDEYAGLGGASDDDSNDELDEDLKQMVEEGRVDVDERQMAAFYAERERAEDEKRIDKLYKDIANGGLRKRRGGNFDLSDSEDDGAEMRRRKQREFARMRKALLEDERVGKIAENPKKLAFLRAIEDHDDDDDIDFLEAPTDDSQQMPIADSQEQAENGEQQPAAPAQAGPSNPLKRKSPSAPDSADQQRPPARLRRTAPTTSMPPPMRKPTTLAEIRESVSSLLENPSIQEEVTLSDSDSDADDNDGPSTSASATMASRRSARPVVDRLSLSRSSTAASSDANSGPLAFHAPAGSTHRPGFRVPTLLRRATTNLSTTSTTSTTSDGSNGSGGGGAGGAAAAEVRRGGSKKSNIHYQAREAERKKVVEAAERKRKEGLKRKVGVGRRSGLAGYLGTGGGFE